MRWFVRMGVLALTVLVIGGAGREELSPQREPQIHLEVAKNRDLGKIIARHIGKVVVVDFWSVTCTPCCQQFCHLVELHRKYAREGLVVVSVSLDEDPHKAEVQHEVMEFLKKQKATFTNLLLDEPYEVWAESLGIASPPCVMVFSRTGRWQKFDGESLDGIHDEGQQKLEQLVQEWLHR